MPSMATTLPATNTMMWATAHRPWSQALPPSLATTTMTGLSGTGLGGLRSWMGRSAEPTTLNKYVYGNADPANVTDPTGHFGLASSRQPIVLAPRYRASRLMWV